MFSLKTKYQNHNNVNKISVLNNNSVINIKYLYSFN